MLLAYLPPRGSHSLFSLAPWAKYPSAFGLKLGRSWGLLLGSWSPGPCPPYPLLPGDIPHLLETYGRRTRLSLQLRLLFACTSWVRASWPRWWREITWLVPPSVVPTHLGRAPAPPSGSPPWLPTLRALWATHQLVVSPTKTSPRSLQVGLLVFAVWDRPSLPGSPTGPRTSKLLTVTLPRGEGPTSPSTRSLPLLQGARRGPTPRSLFSC